jgi:Cu/Ag efflux protein CusF
MTMAFAVKDPSMLSKVKVGDKVKFRVDNVKDVATVTALTVQK